MQYDHIVVIGFSYHHLEEVSVKLTRSVQVLFVCMAAFSAIIGIAGCSVRHVAAKSDDPNAAWTKQKAVECQGDMTKLSGEDQQKLKDLYGFPGAPSTIARDYRDSKGAE